MNFQSLRAFELVAVHGSISAAARVMQRSRPQVSLWVSELEDKWQLQLFDRTGHKVELTRDGQEMLHRVRMLNRQVTNVVQSAESLAANEEVSFRLGFDKCIPAELRIDVIDAFIDKFFKTQLEVKVDTAFNMVKHLENGRVDVAVGHCSSREERYFEANRVESVVYVVCCHPEHELALKEEISRDEILFHRAILLEGVAEELGIENSIMVSDYESVIDLTRKGRGWCLCPMNFARKHLEAGELTIVNNELAVTRLSIDVFWHGSYVPRKCAKWVLDYARGRTAD